MPLNDKVLAEAAARILAAELRPVRYQLLANMALQDIGHVCETKERLDIQEQLSLWARKGKQGLVYLRHPSLPDLHHVGLVAWFDPSPFPLFPDMEKELRLAGEANVIDLTADNWSSAWYELEQRTPFMQNKFGKEAEKLAVDRLLSLTAEEAIKEACKRLWPRLYYDADNYRQYSKPCEHDFKLLRTRRTGKKAFLHVDVCTPNKNSGQWGPVRSGMKLGTDAHLCARVIREDDGRPTKVEFCGFLGGREFADRTHCEEELMPVWRLQLFINCEQSDVPADLETLRKIAFRGLRAVAVPPA